VPGKRESGRAGERESGRAGEWESGRAGEWSTAEPCHDTHQQYRDPSGRGAPEAVSHSAPQQSRRLHLVRRVLTDRGTVVQGRGIWLQLHLIRRYDPNPWAGRFRAPLPMWVFSSLLDANPPRSEHTGFVAPKTRVAALVSERQSWNDSGKMTCPGWPDRPSDSRSFFSTNEPTAKKQGREQEG
jgi:hypothetical protein